MCETCGCHDLGTSFQSNIKTPQLYHTPQLMPGTFVRYDNDGVSIIISDGKCEPLLVNRTITDILRLMDGATTIAQIVQKLYQKYRQVEYEVLERDVLKVVGYLVERGIAQSQ